MTTQQRKRTGRATVTPSREPLRSGFQSGDRSSCDECAGEMIFARGLVHWNTSRLGLNGVANLAGFQCQQCGNIHWDAPSYEAIRQSVIMAPKGFAARAKASKLARKMIGIYIPTDIRNFMNIQPGDDMEMSPVEPDIMIVKVHRASQSRVTTSTGDIIERASTPAATYKLMLALAPSFTKTPDFVIVSKKLGTETIKTKSSTVV